MSVGGGPVFWGITVLLSSAVVVPASSASSSYVAAVFEHRVILNPEPRVPTSRAAALKHMKQNLDVYEEQAAHAARQGVQILVFPEDGIQGFNFTRSSISSYLETIPDPQQESWNPCTEPGRHGDTEVLQTLSCMARRHNLYLVANMGDLQPCSADPDPAHPAHPASPCPPDGRWQFNTNVAFSSEGLLVARYHKHNLYFEDAFDTPPRPEVVTFDTPFAGRFGLIICFDILFREPTISLLEEGVRQVIFPTAWMNQLPLLDLLQFQQAFSRGANLTLLSANIRSDALMMTGSGIYTPSRAVYHHARRGDPEEGRLVVARVPVLEWAGRSQEEEEEEEEGAEPGYCQRDSCPPPSPAFTSSMMHDPFKLVVLSGEEGHVSSCDGTFCCRLRYRRFGGQELHALAAFAGTHVVNGRYAVQVCAVVRCAGAEPSSCGQEVEEAETRMDFQLEGKFGTKYVFPSLLSSRLVLERPQLVERRAGGRVTMTHRNMTGGLVAAYLYGRMYHLDHQ